MSNYQKKINKIKEKNVPLLKKFRAHLQNNGLAPKTIKNHIDKLDFFQST